MKMGGRQPGAAGITLIEMLVVLVMLSLFAALVMPNLLKKPEQARRAAAEVQIDAFLTALSNYHLDTGSFPPSEAGLAALVVNPGGVTRWNGPYLPKDVPLDPWGRVYLYKYPGGRGDLPEITSLGADGSPGGEGNNADIVSWKNAPRQ
ncbi:MAG: type II secretion system major pseudopilin GspG [Bryobacteraceae bacterium]|nr:type II secretion system major pseudopilin GspG [Bryobacteraceae bacterium]